jgi:hypothetical protein
MGKVCARCGKFGEWKAWTGGGVYKGRPLCGGCRLIVKKPKAKSKKKSDNSSRDRDRYLEKVENR